MTFSEFRTAVEALIAGRPGLEQSDLPNLLRFGVAHEALQKVELKADLLLIAREVRQHQQALVKQWHISKEMKDYLRRLVSELLRAHNPFAYKAKFGDRARKYIEKVERDVGTNIFAAAWTLDPIMKATLMKEIEYEAGQERSDLKSKATQLDEGIKKEWDIVRLTVTIIHELNILPSAALQPRIAFLRSFLAGQHGPFTQKDFWNKVDVELNDIRKGGPAEVDALVGNRFYSKWFNWDIQKWPVQPESQDALRDVEALSVGL
ncbi:hypothetical protein BT69DRAFT_1348035 [Atractiella rhizophila]|nr:hypothetical protein BT69DRAFT_1348035 [Atractiella rhizophila]